MTNNLDGRHAQLGASISAQSKLGIESAPAARPVPSPGRLQSKYRRALDPAFMQADTDLIRLCTDYHLLDRQFNGALSIWCRVPSNQITTARVAEEACDLIARHQAELLRQISVRSAAGPEALCAKARVVAAYFDLEQTEDCPAQSALWSVVRDAIGDGSLPRRRGKKS